MDGRKLWTQREILIALTYIDEPAQLTADKLGRSVNSVRSMRYRLAELYSSCDEDCEHCVFSDCFRPADSFDLQKEDSRCC